MRDKWMSDGTCTQVDPELFFDEEYQSVALDVCSMCPVLKKCREWAVVTRLPAGVAGGMTANAREVEARRRGLPFDRDGWASSIAAVMRVAGVKQRPNYSRSVAS